MKKYFVFLTIIIVLIISFFLTQDLRVGNVVEETIIKEVIPYELSKAFHISYKRISIIESEEIEKGWRCYFFALSSEQSNELFIATVFTPPKKVEERINYLEIAENTCLLYLSKIVKLQNTCIIGSEIIRSNIHSSINVGFVALRLKNIRIDGKPFKEYLQVYFKQKQGL